MRSASSLIDTPCASGLDLAVGLGASLATSLRLKNVGLSKVGRMLAEAPDSLDAGASAAWAIGALGRPRPATRAKAVSRGKQGWATWSKSPAYALFFGR